MKCKSILIVGMLLLTLYGCGSETIPPGGSGMLEADESIVSAEASGRVVITAVVEGADVEAGDTLLTIDSRDLQLQLEGAEASRAAAEARLEVARVNVDQASESADYLSKERDRIGRLVSSGTATSQRFDQLNHEATQADIQRRAAIANVGAIRAEIKTIDAQIAQIKKRLSDCHPTVPIGGIITEKYVDIGELLSPGKPIAKISQLDTLWVKVYLPTAAFAHVKIGDKATIDTEGGGNTYEGYVTWTSEAAEFTPKNVQTEKSRTNLVYAVKVRVPNTDGTLKIGMPVFVTLNLP